MALQVIGAGLGRTGTYSLKLAINQLGLGPCYHMEAVAQDMAANVPLWSAALEGQPDWPTIYAGYPAAVDWPTAAFYRELHAAYPEAKFVLTHRSPESWADSFGETIYKLLAGRDQAPPEARPWLEMVVGVIERNGFPQGLDRDGLVRGFVAHNQAVRDAIPPAKLLAYEVKEGWGPLCEFLGVDVPSEPFPRTNSRTEFWDLVKSLM